MTKLICKHCGCETSTVICSNCGINVVWYNKYGQLNDDIESGELDLLSYLNKDSTEKPKIEEVVKEVFNPDGSGD